jgi:hypothetical protein
MRRLHIAWIAVLLFAAPPLAAQDLGFRGWGLRAGAASDPDQFLIGVHLDLGDIVENLRLQPSFEAGAGDDATTLQALVPVHYRFPVGGSVTPYAGGGVLLALLDFDDEAGRGRGRDDDEDFDIAPVGVGGLEWSLAGGQELLLELQVGGGDAFDAKVMVGWTF